MDLQKKRPARLWDIALSVVEVYIKDGKKHTAADKAVSCKTIFTKQNSCNDKKQGHKYNSGWLFLSGFFTHEYEKEGKYCQHNYGGYDIHR